MIFVFLSLELFLLLLLFLLFHPSIPEFEGKNGKVLSWWRAWREARQREWIEDALKYLLEREQEGRHASLESLAGSLGLSLTHALRLVNQMEARGLLEWQGRLLHLTPSGERWALHVMRAHRLWERYLADEARMPLEKVHAEAHRREHRLNEQELEALEAALGYPQQDPHGDPIPGREAHPESGARPGTELTRWELDRPARIVHLEDEPKLAYAQILAIGLRLGQVVRLIERTPQRLVLSDGENEYRLAPAVAANVYVVDQIVEAHAGEAIPLSQLTELEEAEIVAIDEAVQGLTRRRFLDLGLTPGARVRPELRNLFGDPRAYRVRGTLIALRREQAEKVWVRAPFQLQINSE